MLMGLNGRAGQPATRSAIGCAATARRMFPSLHRHPHRAECSAVALPTAAASALAIGGRGAPVRKHPH